MSSLLSWCEQCGTAAICGYAYRQPVCCSDPWLDDDSAVIVPPWWITCGNIAGTAPLAVQALPPMCRWEVVSVNAGIQGL